MGEMNLATTLPAELPVWLDVQPEALDAAFNSTAHRERWKYTRPKKVLALLEEAGARPTWGSAPHGVTISTAAEANVSPELFANREEQAPEALMNLCRQQALVVIDVADDIAEPLHLDFASHSLPVLLRIGANAALELHETTNTDADVHQSLWVELGPGSRLNHTRQAFGGGSHWQHLAVRQDRDSTYTLHNHCSGATLRRQDVHITSAGRGAVSEIFSACFVPEGSHFDLQITMEHGAPQTHSRQRVHTIAADRGKATFNGRIYIHANSSGVDAELQNKNLALGDGAVINSKPELEIYTDDVKCAHGATIGQIDPDHLFYCASRGISAVAAQRLLSQAFLSTCTEGPFAEDSRSRFAEYLR